MNPVKSETKKTIIMFAVTDFTDTIMLKLFARNDDVADILAYIAPGNFVKAKGVVTVDKYDSDLSISSIVGLKRYLILHQRGRILLLKNVLSFTVTPR